jgi:hypothetical protein
LFPFFAFLLVLGFTTPKTNQPTQVHYKQTAAPNSPQMWKLKALQNFVLQIQPQNVPKKAKACVSNEWFQKEWKTLNDCGFAFPQSLFTVDLKDSYHHVCMHQSATPFGDQMERKVLPVPSIAFWVGDSTMDLYKDNLSSGQTVTNQGPSSFSYMDNFIGFNNSKGSTEVALLYLLN